jgi:excisionase family DNA binding protein
MLVLLQLRSCRNLSVGLNVDMPTRPVVCCTPMHANKQKLRAGILTVTLQQAAEITGLSIRQLYNLIDAGQISTTKVRKRRLIHYESLRRLVGLPAGR